MRLVVGSMLVQSPSPVNSSSVSLRRSEPSLPWSTSEVEDDKWDPVVSDSAFKMNFLFFRFKWIVSVFVIFV